MACEGVPRAPSPRGRQVAPPRCFSRERAARGAAMPPSSSRGQKTAISQVFGGSGEEWRVAALRFPRSEAWALKSPAHGPARSPFFVHADARSPNFVHLPGQKPAISHPAPPGAPAGRPSLLRGPPGDACWKAQSPPRADAPQRVFEAAALLHLRVRLFAASRSPAGLLPVPRGWRSPAGPLPVPPWLGMRGIP